MEKKELSNGKKSFIQLIKFGLVGVSNTLVDIIVTSLLIFLVGHNENAVVSALYNIIGYSCGIVNSFIWNTKWTFKKEYRKTKAELFKFIAVNVISCGISVLLVHVFSTYVFANSAITDWVCGIVNYTEAEQHLKIVKLLSKLVSAVCVILINFTLTKLFVFNQKDTDTEEKG